MVKSFAVILLFLFFKGTYIFAQTDEQKKQEFGVDNFIVKTPEGIDEQAFYLPKFNLTMSNAGTDYATNPITLFYRLKNSSGTNLLEGQYEKCLYAKSNPARPSEGLEKDIILKIPYALMGLQSGIQIVTLEFWASYEGKMYDVFFSKQLKITVPKLFDYAEQKIGIRNLSVKSGITYKGVEGLEFTFDAEYSFLASETRELHQSPDFKLYTYTLAITDKKSGTPISVFEKKIIQTTETASSKIQTIKIHVPYNQIASVEGKNECSVAVFAKGYARALNFGESKIFNFNYVQPAVYLGFFRLNSLEAEYKLYDSSNAFGRLFSKKSSNVGKGYPDTYWLLETGAISVYESAQNSNSFSAYAGITHFTLVDSDPIYLAVYDYDALNVNDLMGLFRIEHSVGNSTVRKDNFSFPGIVSSSFEFQKLKFPTIHAKTFTKTICKHDGVSGLCLDGHIGISQIPQNQQVTIQPMYYTKAEAIDLQYYTNKINQLKPISSTSNEIDVSLFFPFFELQDVEKLGLSLNLLSLNYKIGDIILDESVKIPNFDDTDVSFQSEGDKINANGIRGYSISIGYKIPEFYWDKGSLNSKIVLTDNSKQLMLDTLVQTNRIQTLFIPYYKLVQGKENQIDISEETFLNKSFRIGVNSSKTKLTCPQLIDFHVSELEFTTSESPTSTELFVKIEHDGRMVSEGTSASNGVKFKFNVKSKSIKVHPKDVIKLTVFEKDSFGIANSLGTYEFSADDFKKSKHKARKPIEGIKKLKIVIE